MSLFDRDTQLSLAAEAGRAPSAHNTQPARWRFTGSGDVLLFEDKGRRLPIGDPTGRDHRIGLGAAFEGMNLALSRRGFGLDAPDLKPLPNGEPADGPGLNLMARTPLRSVPRVDPLVGNVFRRGTFRGTFRPADDRWRDRVASLCAQLPDIVPIFDNAAIEAIAALHDRSSQEFLAQPDYLAELYRWIRFSPAHPGWARDGLTADALGLSRIERLGARLLLRPGVFAILAASPLASLLVSEAGQTRSACAILLLTARTSEDPFVTGRRFYRVWLEICGAGFSLCPMSALSDSVEGAAWLRRRCAISEDVSVVNVFRVGPAPERPAPASPRIPAEELLV